ncbi:MAG: DUF1593 domain-containing protein [Verrucomicrobiae bacterium]|nr:DUF1593 domain-containing protein [Verrucomicrobiae bacterium]
MTKACNPGALLSVLLAASLAAAEKPRCVVVSDMTHDDGNSLIRMLYYANELDLEAITIAPQEPDHRWNSDAPWKKVQAILDAYAKVYDRLKAHDPAYPTPEYLRRITKRGHGALPIIWLTKGHKVDDWIGEGRTPNGQPKDSEASDFLVEVLLRDNPRPLYVGLWGAPLVFSQALYCLQSRQPAERVAQIMAKVHVYSIHLQDITMDYFFDLPRWQATPPGKIQDFAWTPWSGPRFLHPPARLLVDINHFWFYIGESQAITAQVPEHGPLAALYDRGGEGDTPAFLFLLSANLGLNDPWDPTQGSWGGRFTPGKGDGQPWPNVFSTARVRDRELKRWAPDVRASFLARLQYTIKPPGEVNHPPRVVLNGDRSAKVLRLAARPGQTLTLDAAGTADPDGNELTYKWWHYQETGTYSKPLKLPEAHQPVLRWTAPDDLGDQTVHLVLEVRDNGSPSLVAYRRVILTGTPAP